MTRNQVIPPHLANVAAPADAQSVREWRDDEDNGEFDRYFTAHKRHTDGVGLTVAGFQAADGTTRRHVNISALDVELDAAGVRRLTDELAAVAQHLGSPSAIGEPLTFPLADVAERIPCSERWLTEQVRSGRIPGRKIGRHWRMTAADIETALDTFGATPSSPTSKTRSNEHPMSLTPTSQRRKRT